MFDNNHKFNMWLRSPGDSGKQVAFLHNKFGVTAGRTSMCPPTNGSNTITGLVYPAVWVDQEIFDMANSHRTPPAPIISFPVGVTGRTLTPDMSGDTSEWIEIAQNGEYSLLVRRHFINIYPHATQGSKIVYNDPEAQRSSFGVNTNYMESYIREDINRWFSGDAKLEAEKLPANARLRDYTVQTTVKYDIGTSSTHKGVVDGFSKPTHYQAGIGNDIAFLLSFSEVANFLSLRHHLRGVMVNGVHSPLAPSSAVAIANYNKIVFPGTFTRFNMWLRSVGDIAGQVGFLHNPHYVTSAGMAFQSHVGFNTIGGMAYPAVWVKSSIFGPTERQVTVVHHVPDETYYGPDDVYKEYSREYITAMDGDVLRSETYVIPEGPNFIYIYDEDKPTYLVVSNSDAVLDIFYKGPTG